MRGRRAALGLLLLALTAGAASSVAAQPTPASHPPVVVAVVGELGANLLHQDFQVHGGVSQIPGAPRADQVHLPTGGDFPQRLARARAGLLGAVPPGRLVHVTGTNVFVYNATGAVQDVLAERKHGTAVLGAAASTVAGSAPRSAYVLVLGSEPGWAWVADQAWIDVATTSFFSIGAPCPTGPEARRASSGGKLVLAAAGNNTTAELAFAPAGLPEVVRVGGVQPDGRSSPGSTHPYEVGDLFTQELPGPDDDLRRTVVSGTSYAAPRAAGRASALVRAARQVLADPRSGVRRGLLAVAPRRAGVRSGPLADGGLDASELRRLLQVTAAPAEADPELRYAQEGFGALGAQQQRAALDVLRGVAPPPERAPETADHDTYQAVAQALTPEARCGARAQQVGPSGGAGPRSRAA